MKKLAIIGIIIITILVIVVMQISNIQKQKQQAIAFNKQYEEYQNKDLYGIDVVTVINRAIDNNTKYNVSQDEEGMYIEDENSIKVELNLISGTDEKTGEDIIVTHQMETLQNSESRNRWIYQ